MLDWTKSMQQTFEYYVVDPDTWKDVRPIDCVKTSTINRDADSETRGSATFDITENIDECYIRIYLVTIQNGVKEKHPLGTYLAQTPSSSYDGKVSTYLVDGYTPLIELKEKHPPLGFSIEKKTDEKIMVAAHRLTQEHCRAPVVPASSNSTLDDYNDNFVADPKDTWLGFLSSLISITDASGDEPKYSFDLDEMGRILFAPVQKTEALQPIWTYTDDNSSILLPDITLDRDIYGIPNVVEVIYSTGGPNGKQYYGRAVNDDENSPTSTINRGREITYRITDPKLVGVSGDDEDIDGIKQNRQVHEYAKQVLKEMSTVEYTVTYTHGYCPVRVDDCVLLNYTKAGLNNIKAKVISQSISCKPGCQVNEKAVFTNKLWR
jgi:hypothetical protein